MENSHGPGLQKVLEIVLKANLPKTIKPILIWQKEPSLLKKITTMPGTNIYLP